MVNLSIKINNSFFFLFQHSLIRTRNSTQVKLYENNNRVL